MATSKQPGRVSKEIKRRTKATSQTAETAANEIVAIGIRMSDGAHKDLKTIAYWEDVSLNSLLVEGVAMIVADRKRQGKIPPVLWREG